MDEKFFTYCKMADWQELSQLIGRYKSGGIFVLVDGNTNAFCLPVLMSQCPELHNANVIRLGEGETVKSIVGLEYVWNMLAEKGATRSSLLVCLGGGVLTDLGGFAAATFMRGMDFVHIPTTLLAMVDAALGGKTAVNLKHIKNQIGLFAVPKGVFVFPEFLKTLSLRQQLSGYAEMLKSALIGSPEYFDVLKSAQNIDEICEEEKILQAVRIKMDIVSQDPLEKGLRKVLNFGHTVGHAVETHAQCSATPLLHGEAVAIGLICETYISVRLLGFPQQDFEDLVKLIFKYFNYFQMEEKDTDSLLALMLHDKKNINKQQCNFSLLKAIGEPVINQYPPTELIRESMLYYMQIKD